MNRLFTYIVFFFMVFSCTTQKHNNSQVKQKSFEELFTSLDFSNDQTYVVNFWATWCSPCIKELPHFEYINKKYDNKIVKVYLVSLDLPEHLNSKLIPFIKKNNLLSEVVHLTDTNLNVWMPKISNEWNGGIPATLIINKNSQKFYPNPFEKDELIYEIEDVISKTFLNGLGSR